MDPEEIQGVDPQQLEEAAAAMEALIAAALTAVAVAAAAEILIPGIPLVDVDALSVIPTLWTVRAERDLIPVLEVTIRIVTEMLRGEIDEALPLDFPLVPEISDTTAAQILAGARNRLVGIGDILWQNARTSLVEGVELGEDVPALAARVREAADVTVPRSRTIARTEVISASNSASIAQARSANVDMEKGWLATEDDRTRPAHAIADGQWVPLDGMFDVGGELLDFPGDPEGRADNVINERCSIIYRITGMSPTVAAAGRHYVRDNDGQFARVPGAGLPGEFERLDSFDADALEIKFGGPVDTVTVGDEFEDDTQRLRIRIFPDGTSHLSNDVKGPNGEERFQPFTDQLTSDELREMAESLDSAIDFDPDDYDEDDDDADGIMAWVRAPDNIEFGRYRNGDIRLTRTAPIDRDEPDRSEMYLYDFGEDEQQDLLRELNDAADRQEEVEAGLEEEDEDDLADAIYLDTEGMGEVVVVPRPEDGAVEFSFPDQPQSSMALDVPEAEAVSAALANARRGFGESQPDSEVPFFSEVLTFGQYSGMNLEGYNADGTFVFQMTGTGVLARIGTISLEGDDPEEFENILDQALDAMAVGPVTASSAVPHLHTCTEGLKVNGRWPPGPCKGWKNNLPAGDPRKGAPGAAKTPRAAAPRKRVLAPNDPGLTEGMNPAQRGAAEQAVVDRARSRGEMLAALSELVENDAPADVLTHRAGSLKRGLGDSADASVDKVIAAGESGDKAKMRRAVKAAAKKWGLAQVGKYGTPVTFDPKVHRTFGGGASVRPADGEPVMLDRPGFTFRDHEGNDLNLVKAVVSKAVSAAETPDTREDMARARQTKIDAARSRASVLAEAEELLLNEEEPDIIARNLTKLAQRLKVDGDPAIAAVVAAADGHPEGLRQKVREAAGQFGLRQVGAPQQPFDPRQHHALGDRPREGALVDLVRPGYTATVDGEQVLVEKAVVEKADRPSPARAPYASGRNLLAGDAGKLAADVEAAISPSGVGVLGDQRLAEIARRQGFDGKPEVLSKTEMDTRIGAGAQELFRGIYRGEDASRTPQDYAEQFRSGDWYTGFGQFGNGTYSTPNAGYAALSYADEGVVMRMAIRPDAKVIGQRQLLDEQGEYLNSIDMDPSDPRFAVFADPGRFAAARGYDVVHIARGHVNDEYLIVNRTAVSVEAP